MATNDSVPLNPEAVAQLRLCPRIKLRSLAEHASKFIAANESRLQNWTGQFFEVMAAKVVLIWRKRGLKEEAEHHGEWYDRACCCLLDMAALPSARAAPYPVAAVRGQQITLDELAATPFGYLTLRGALRLARDSGFAITTAAPVPPPVPVPVAAATTAPPTDTDPEYFTPITGTVSVVFRDNDSHIRETDEPNADSIVRPN